MSSDPAIHLIGDDDQAITLKPDTNVIYPSPCSALDHERIVASNKIKFKPAVKYFWEYRYYLGNLICKHPLSSLVAYCINTSNGSKTTSMVRIRSSESAQKVLIKNFSEKILTMEFATCPQATLAIMDYFPSVRVYKIHTSASSTELTVECILVFRLDGALMESEHGFLHWCAGVPGTSSALHHMNQKQSDTESDFESPTFLAISYDKTAHVLDVAKASDLFRTRFPSGSYFGIASDKSEESVCGHSSEVGLTYADLSEPDGPEASLLKTIDHSSAVTGVLLTTDASFLLTGCLDGRVRLFSIPKTFDRPKESLVPIHEFSPHDGIPVYGLCFLDNPTQKDFKPDSYLLTGSQFNQELRVWSTKTWTCLQTLRFCAPDNVDQTTDLPSSSAVLPATKPSIVFSVDRVHSLLVATDITRRVLYILNLAQDKTAHDSDDYPLRFTSITEFLLSTPCIMFALGACDRRSISRSDDSSTPVDQVELELHTIHSWYLLNGTVKFELPLEPQNSIPIRIQPSDSLPLKYSPTASDLEKTEELTQVSQQLLTANDLEPAAQTDGPVNSDSDKANECVHDDDNVPPSLNAATNIHEVADEDFDVRLLRPTDFSPAPVVDESPAPRLNNGGGPTSVEQETEVNRTNEDVTVHSSSDDGLSRPFYIPESIEDAMKRHAPPESSVEPPDNVCEEESRPLIDVPQRYIESEGVKSTGYIDLQSSDGSIGNAASLMDLPQDSDEVRGYPIGLLSGPDMGASQQRQDVNWSTASLYSYSPSRSSAKQGQSSENEEKQSKGPPLVGDLADGTGSDSASSVAQLLQKLLSQSNARNQQMLILMSELKETKEQLQNVAKMQTELSKIVFSGTTSAQVNDVGPKLGELNNQATTKKTSSPGPDSSVNWTRNHLGGSRDTPPEWSKQLFLQLRTQQGDFARRFTQMECAMNHMKSMTEEMHKENRTKPASSNNADSRVDQIPKLTSDHLRPIIRSEVQNAIINNVPRIVDPIQKVVSRVVQECMSSLPTIVSENLLRISREKNFTAQLSRGLSASLTPDLGVAYRDSLSKIFVPALERNINKLFEEINTVFRAGTVQYLDEVNGRIASILDPTVICDRITAELKSAITNTPTTVVPSKIGPSGDQDQSKFHPSRPTPDSRNTPGLKPVSSARSLRTTDHEPIVEPSSSSIGSPRITAEIEAKKSPATSLTKKEEFARLSGQARSLIKSERWAEALEMALVSTNQALVLDVCSDIDPYKLFTSGKHSVGQNVILSLIHQLSCGDFKLELELKVRYLQEAVSCLNQEDPTTKEHGPRILNLLVRRLEVFMENCSKGAAPKLSPQMQTRLVHLKYLAKSLLDADGNVF